MSTRIQIIQNLYRNAIENFHKIVDVYKKTKIPFAIFIFIGKLRTSSDKFIIAGYCKIMAININKVVTTSTMKCFIFRWRQQIYEGAIAFHLQQTSTRYEILFTT